MKRRDLCHCGHSIEAHQKNESCDVLITHGPPRGILDCNIGDEWLSHRVAKLKPRYHIFGHIHGGYGNKKIGMTRYINCAVMDNNYDIKNKPQVIII